MFGEKTSLAPSFSCISRAQRCQCQAPRQEQPAEFQECSQAEGGGRSAKEGAEVGSVDLGVAFQLWVRSGVYTKSLKNHSG